MHYKPLHWKHLHCQKHSVRSTVLEYACNVPSRHTHALLHTVPPTPLHKQHMLWLTRFLCFCSCGVVYKCCRQIFWASRFLPFQTNWIVFYNVMVTSDSTARIKQFAKIHKVTDICSQCRLRVTDDWRRIVIHLQTAWNRQESEGPLTQAQCNHIEGYKSVEEMNKIKYHLQV